MTDLTFEQRTTLLASAHLLREIGRNHPADVLDGITGWDSRPIPHCFHCHEAIVEYPHGWEHVHAIGSPILCGNYDWTDLLDPGDDLEQMDPWQIQTILEHADVTRATPPA